MQSFVSYKIFQFVCWVCGGTTPSTYLVKNKYTPLPVENFQLDSGTVWAFKTGTQASGTTSIFKGWGPNMRSDYISDWKY